ncbi:MAG: tetratricopeptide repeat protein [Campylobacterales bacterium]|nr:tetratricopeptide repeat protein [Campylobacterales bacterium]
MINEFIEYRDPLFGIIVIVLFIFITSFLTYSYGLYKERNARKEYRKLLKRFELGNLKEDDYIHLYKTYNLPFDSIVLLASSFLHKGEYNKAISVYLALLEHAHDTIKKEELLELLGNAYFKSGMLQRSKDIYLKILQFNPRNKVALHQLLLIFQYLKEYIKAQEVLDALNELDEDIIKEQIYLKVMQIINDPLLSFETKSLQLLSNFKMNKVLERVVAEYLIKFNKALFWENIELFSHLKILDLLWYLDFDDIDFEKVQQITQLQQIYSAKGYVDIARSSSQFELSVLIANNNSNAKTQVDLNFEFLCSKCKKIHPIYETRCPHCHSILSLKVQPKIAKNTMNLASLL